MWLPILSTIIKVCAAWKNGEKLVKNRKYNDGNDNSYNDDYIIMWNRAFLACSSSNLSYCYTLVSSVVSVCLSVAFESPAKTCSHRLQPNREFYMMPPGKYKRVEVPPFAILFWFLLHVVIAASYCSLQQFAYLLSC